jgi:hypothetical protein
MHCNQTQPYQSIQKYLKILKKLVNTHLMFSLPIVTVQEYYFIYENITDLQKLFTKKYHNTYLLLQ